MVINDRVYGKVKISSPVIIELIKSKPLQRLKGICQYGVPNEFYHLKNYSRFEHSIGVMILLKKLGASEEEQISGLIHDVSHTAFSHIIDWVLGSGRLEDRQDRQHDEFVNSSEIKSILIKYGYNPIKIVDCHNFGLLERKIPDICADRIDYAFREFSKNNIRKCLKNLLVVGNKIIFKNKLSALLFANNFLNKQTQHWGGFEAAVRYRLFADVLRYAMGSKTLVISGFWERPAENLNHSILDKHIAFCGGVAGKSMCVSPSEEVFICGYSGKKFANLSKEEILHSETYHRIVTKRLAGRIERCMDCPIEGQCIGGCFITEEFNSLEKEAALKYNCELYRRMTVELLKDSLKEAASEK